MSSPVVYTIDIGPLEALRQQEITLLHHGQPCFSTTHEGVQSALLIKFPDLHFTSSHEPPFSTFFPSPLSSSLSLDCEGEEQRFHERTSAFHHSSSPSSLEAGTRDEKGKAITTVIPYYSSPAFELSKATDYLCVFHTDELHRPYEDQAGLAGHSSLVCTSYDIESCTTQQFPLPDICPTYFCSGVFGVWIHATCPSGGERWHGSTLPETVDVHGVCYTAAADLWWMISPLVVHPVYVRTSVLDGGWQASPWPVFSPSLSVHPSHAPAVEMKVVVLTQFVARGQALWTVVQCRPDTVGLAVTTPYYPLDILLWEWLPQRVTLPGVCCASSSHSAENSNAIRVPRLDVTVSEHAELGRQILFLTSVAPSSSVYILQTPDLLTREGEFCLLFVLPPSIHRQVVCVLHCMLPSFCPQPIVVMNYPSRNRVAFFDVCSLLDAGAAATFQEGKDPSASLWQVAPPYFACVPVPTAPEAELSHRRHHGACKRTRKEDTEHDGPREDAPMSAMTPTRKKDTSEATTWSWVLDGIVEENGARMVFSTAPVLSVTDTPSTHSSPSSAEKADAMEASEGAGRRDARGVAILHSPSFMQDHPPMLRHVLEILRATLGTKALWELQYTVLREAWHRTTEFHHTRSARLLMVLYACLLETVSHSLYGKALPAFSFAADCDVGRTKTKPSAGPCASLSSASSGSLSKGRRENRTPGPRWSSLVSFEAIEEMTRAIRLEREEKEEEEEEEKEKKKKREGHGRTDERIFTTTTTTTSSSSSSSAVQTRRVEVPPLWSPYTCGLLCIGLHLLYESAQLQESLWSSLLVLGKVNLALSQLLRWKAYYRFYRSLHGDPLVPVPSLSTATNDCTKAAGNDGREKEEDDDEKPMGGECWEAAVARATPTVLIPSAATVRTEAFRQRILVDISVFYQEAKQPPQDTAFHPPNKVSIVEEEEEEEEKPLALLSLLRRMVERRGGGGTNPTFPHFLPSTMDEGANPTASGSSHPSHLSWWVLAGVPEEHPLALSHHVYALYALAFHDHAYHVHLSSSSFTSALPSVFLPSSSSSSSSLPPWWWRVIAGLCSAECPLSSSMVHHQLSLGVAYPLLQAIARGRANVGNEAASLKDEVLAKIGRIDVIRSRSVQSPKGKKDDGNELKVSFPTTDGKSVRTAVTGADVVRLAEERAISWSPLGEFTKEDDGIQMPPDFPSMWIDTRLERVLKLLNTTVYVSLRDADVKVADTKMMELLSWRVCASPIARGMVTMCTKEYKSCDRIPIPSLNLNGMTETGIVVPMPDFDHSKGELPRWALFHNSCAAGLRFFPLRPSLLVETGGMENTAPSTSYTPVSREKLLYQARSVEMISRAGLLFTAGLLGHFEPLQLTDVYTFLTASEPEHAIRELMTIALLLGLSCTYRGTSNPTVFKCLSVHILSLTPSEEHVEIRLNVQTAAFVAVGLLCQSQPVVANAFLLDVLIVEMTRRPTDEHCVDREGYVLGAAFGLGLILLGCGNSATMSNFRAPIVETLLTVMEGGERMDLHRTLSGNDSFQEKGVSTHETGEANTCTPMGASSGQQCSLVYEGRFYNAVVEGPAAVMALGLIFLQTEDSLTATRVALPNSFLRLLSVTPTMCLFRSLIAPLICWSSIAPTTEWVYAQAPPCLNELFLEKLHYPSTSVQQRQYSLLLWGYSIAGTVLALGLRYAGTMNPLARKTILAELHGFLRHEIGSSGIRVTAVQKSTGAFVPCISCCCIAASIVMAGTGDAELFHLFQELHQRVGVQDALSYGVYMAVSMSAGFLFLGGGRLTLSNSTSSIAALLISLYPTWPRDVNDNHRHLQAFRYLYVLAVVPRIIDAVDVHTQRPVSVPIRVRLQKGALFTSQGEVEARRASGLCRASSGVAPLQGMHGKKAFLQHGYNGEEDANDTPHARPSTIFFTPPGEDGFDGYSSSTAPHGGGMNTEKAFTDVRQFKQREIYMQTPCLYPPPDMVERIDVCSPRHYAISISQKKGTIPSCGIVLQVLKKTPETVCVDAEEKLTHSFYPADDCSGALLANDASTLPYRNPIEWRVADWVKRFFGPPTIPLGESLWILENAKLIFACQRSFMGEFSQASQHLLSLDVGYAVYQTLERHYQQLFDAHARFGCLSNPNDSFPASSYAHPLQLLLVQRLSPEEVLDQWTPVGNAPIASALVHAEETMGSASPKAMAHSAIPSISLMQKERSDTSFPRNYHRGSSVASSMSLEWGDTMEKKKKKLRHWLTQALCFYDLNALKRNKLGKALQRLRTVGTLNHEGVEQHLSAKRVKASMILDLQMQLEIPYHTLLKILSCCSEEGAD